MKIMELEQLTQQLKKKLDDIMKEKHSDEAVIENLKGEIERLELTVSDLKGPKILEDIINRDNEVEEIK